MADNNYYSQQPPGGGGGRGYSSGGRRGGRGRGYRGRTGGGRFPTITNRGGGRSFDSASRGAGRGSYYGASTLSSSVGGRGENSSGRYAPPAVAASSNVPPIMTHVMAPESSSLAPLTFDANTRGRASRGGGGGGGGRFYDSSGRGRRGRGRYSSRARGGRMPTDSSSSQWPPQASHDTTGWNYERNPSFEASRNNSNNASDWNNNNAPNQGGVPMDVESTTSSSDWAGRDREWNSSNTGINQAALLDGNDGAQANWNHQDSGASNWSSYRDGGSNLQDSFRGGPTLPTAPSRASTRSVPFHEQQEQGDIYAKRKRGEAPPYAVGGQPFEEKRLREGPTSSYASLGEGAFQNPPSSIITTTTQQPTIVGDETGSLYSQPYRGSSWRGRGRGPINIRGRTRGRGRGRHIGARGDYGQYSSGRGAPLSNYHEGPQYPDPGSDSVAPGLSAYGPQSTNEFGRSVPGAVIPPSDRTPFSQGDTINTSWGAFRRPSREESPANRPTAPPPAVPSVSHADAAGFSGASASVGTAAVQKPAVSAGSYASLAESSPFLAQVVREPTSVPPVSFSAMDSKPVSARPKSATPPPPEPKPAPRPPTPPSPVGPPSGLMVALARLADLESQLDFALAKHSHVVRERELIQEQTMHLKELPVGVEAFEEDLAKLAPTVAMEEPIQ